MKVADIKLILDEARRSIGEFAVWPTWPGVDNVEWQASVAVGQRVVVTDNEPTPEAAIVALAKMIQGNSP